jgi:hypothetical protein
MAKYLVISPLEIMEQLKRPGTEDAGIEIGMYFSSVSFFPLSSGFIHLPIDK